MVIGLGCGNLIEENNLLGFWMLQIGGDYDENREIHVVSFINKNKVEIFDSGRKEILNYDLIGNDLTIHFKNNEKKEIEFQEIKRDTLIAKDSIFFCRFIDEEFHKGYYYQVEEYELINVDKDYLITLEKPMYRYISFHLYQSNNGNVMLRGLDTLMNIDSASFDILQHMRMQVYFGDKFFYPFMIFIGEGVSLKDLKKAYYELVILNPHWAVEVNLILKKESFNDYFIFKDETDINWFDIYGNDDFINQRKKMPSPPPPKNVISKKDYLKMNPEIVNINSNVDLQKIENLNPQKKYFISIDNELKFEDYIDLKKSIMDIKRFKGIEIRTEIN